MDGGVLLVGVVLNILLQTTLFVDREHIAVACEVVEWVTVDIVWRLVGSENKNCTSLSVGVIGLWVAAHGMRGVVHDVCGRIDGERVPFLHPGAVDGLAVVREGHPGNRFIFRDFCALHEVEGEFLVIKCD